MRKNKYGVFSVLAINLFMSSCFWSSPPKQVDLPYYISADFTPHWLDAKAAANVHTIPDFSFINQEGKIISRKMFDNKITVVDFFFTSCPGICKKLTKNLAMVQAAFKEEGDVLLLSHSVTPEHDSVPILFKYAQINGAITNKWQFVTGDKSAIYKIARTAYFADEDIGMQRDSSSFLHTENILLIDQQHHIRGVYKGTIPAEIDNLIMDIKKLKDEK